MTGGEARASSLSTLGWLALGAACLHGFHGLSAFYGGFDLPQGAGKQHLPVAELVFSAWYLLFGALALAAFACALLQAGLAERALHAARSAVSRPTRLVLACALLALAGSVLFRHAVLLGQVITDDELTYDFIAATLLEGRVSNTPPIAAEFLKNHYVIATDRAWYGKYPIGHPLLLALGKALHLQGLIVPLLGACGVWLTFAIGRRLLGERRAALACVLLALSPQYVWTHATQLSQPTSMLCMLLAVLGSLRLAESGQLRWAALCGGALGYGIVARPAPGLLFVVAALAAYVASGAPGAFREQLGRRARELLVAGAGVAAGVAAVLLVNHAQSGDAFTSGYHSIHGTTGALSTKQGVIAASVGGALLRQNFWLHGWPLSLAFVPFARLRRGAWLVWGMIAAELAYRVLVPKTVVATTGPTYTLEIVPLLCIATLAGMTRVVELLGRLQVELERAHQALVATVLSGTLVALALFVPAQVRSIHRAAAARAAAYAVLEQAGAKRAVVFANSLVSPFTGISWAVFPPSAPPALDADLLFLRMLPGHDGYDRMLRLWQTRFAERRGLLLYLTPQGFVLHELPVQPGTPQPAPIVWANPR